MPEGPRAAARVEAFSDAVLAIAITLLVLDLHPPEEPGSFAHGLASAWPSYLAYLAAFVIIGGLWLNHHALFTLVHRVDPLLLGINLVLLLTASFLPYPTAVVAAAWQGTDRSDKTAALLLFAVTSVAMSLTWLWLCTHAARVQQLAPGESSGRFLRMERRRTVVVIALTVLAFLSVLVSPLVTLVLYVLLPIFYVVALIRTSPTTW